MRSSGKTVVVAALVGALAVLPGCSSGENRAALDPLGRTTSVRPIAEGAAAGALTPASEAATPSTSSRPASLEASPARAEQPRSPTAPTAPKTSAPKRTASSTPPRATVKPEAKTIPVAGSGTAVQEAEVLRLTNVERARAGCRALAANSVLAGVARAHSRDMAQNGYFEHNSQDGTTPFARMKAAGYRYRAAAENIAAGQPTAAVVVDAWMNSEGHRTNILNCALRDLGVGLYRDSGSVYGAYWTQDFGTPR